MLVLLAACSGGETPGTDGKDPVEIEGEGWELFLTEAMVNDLKQQLDDPPALPQTAEQLNDYPAGMFAGKRPAYTLKDNSMQAAQIRYALDLLPDLEGTDKQEWDKYAQYLYSLFKEGYPAPEDYIRNWHWEHGEQQDGAAAPLARSNLHIQIVLDAGPRMTDRMGDYNQMEIVRQILSSFAEQVPAEIALSLWSYGDMERENQQENRSCGNGEQLYSSPTLNVPEFQQVLQQWEGQSEEASELSGVLDQIKQHQSTSDGTESDTTTLLYVISTGTAPCGGDPAASAAAFADPDLNTKLHLIGLQPDDQGHRQLREAAAAAQGWYSNAAGPQDLLYPFNQAADWAVRWSASHNNQDTRQTEDWNEMVDRWSKSWDERMRRQRGNMENALMYLNSEGKISNEAAPYLQQILMDQYEWTRQYAETKYMELKEQGS